MSIVRSVSVGNKGATASSLICDFDFTLRVSVCRLLKNCDISETALGWITQSVSSSVVILGGGARARVSESSFAGLGDEGLNEKYDEALFWDFVGVNGDPGPGEVVPLVAFLDSELSSMTMSCRLSVSMLGNCSSMSG